MSHDIEASRKSADEIIEACAQVVSRIAQETKRLGAPTIHKPLEGIAEEIRALKGTLLAATPSEPTLLSNNTPWGVGGIESFSEGEEPPDDEPESDDPKVEEGQAILDRIRGTLQARAEGRNEGGDIEVMKAVDAIVARERELADKLAEALHSVLVE